MDQDLQELEASLKALRPEALETGFLDRLGDAMGGRLEHNVDSLRPVEAVLRKAAPARLPEDLVRAFDARVAEVPFPVSPKVVMFPRGSRAGETKSRPRKQSWVAGLAAALVAGAFTAMMVNPEVGRSAPAAVASAPTIKDRVKPGVGALVPAGMVTDITGARDKGVVWNADQRPMRVVKVVYMDRLAFTNEQGKRAEIEVPRVEYLLMPVDVE